LDELFSNPVFSIARYCRQSSASYLAVRNAVEFWEEHGLLREISGRKRNRIYLAQEILDATS
jgi:Fe2+ or Zn2+ uptake regulation protein